MDLGCLDLGCYSSMLDKQSNATFVNSGKRDGDAEDSVMATSKLGKNRALKETGQSTLNIVNRSTSHIKKPLHRKTSPLNWFPRKKTDSYLKRKIKLLQEVGGMNSTLVETLGDSNPHYTRVEREQIAAREAAHKVMEARKAAMVEASWCRILRAARIQSKEAEAVLMKAERNVAEAFEAATAMGVIMYDQPDCPQKLCKIESSLVIRGGSTTHTVTTSFETAFDIDKEVSAAVKAALIKLAHCPSSLSKDEIRDLLRKISQTPDMGETSQDLSELSSECESDTGSELESRSQKDEFISHDLNHKVLDAERIQRKCKTEQLPDRINSTNLVGIMLDRLKCLQEDELASLATIVATCGLNAALIEVENSKQRHLDGVILSRRLSSLGSGTVGNSEMDVQMRRKQVVTELPSLDKFLVKHMSRLEREVQEAKNTRQNEPSEGSGENVEGTGDGMENAVKVIPMSEAVPDLGSILIKHSSKLEKEIEEAKRKSGKALETVCKKLGSMPDGSLNHMKQEIQDVPSLEKFLVKHISRLEREVQEAKDRRQNDLCLASSNTNRKEEGKENMNSNNQVHRNLKIEKTAGTMNLKQPNSMECQEKSLSATEQLNLEAVVEGTSLTDGKVGSKEMEDSLERILIKPVHRLEREKMQALTLGRGDYGPQIYQKKIKENDVSNCQSLDKVLVKRLSRLEKETLALGSTKGEEVVKVKKHQPLIEKSEGGGLDEILVKHQSRLEKEKSVAAAQQSGDQIKPLVSRREARERELQEAWGGLSLGSRMDGTEEGKILVKHQSRLEKEKSVAAAQQSRDQIKPSMSRQGARERELQEAWGGLSLGSRMNGTKEEKSEGRGGGLGSMDGTKEEKREGSLDEILVKHQSRLEKEKSVAAAAAAAQESGDQIKPLVSRREVRERELHEAWGGLSLGNSVRPHLSRLERDKAAWIKAEDEERR